MVGTEFEADELYQNAGKKVRLIRTRPIHHDAVPTSDADAARLRMTVRR